MSTFTESSVFEATINKIETTDPVLGGAATAPANQASAQLANRTRYLKDQLEAGGLVASKVLSSGSLDSITQSGFYYVGSGVTTSKPGPTGQGWMTVINNGSTLMAQIYIDQGTNAVYVRRITSGPTFNAWFLLKVDLGTDADVNFLSAQVKAMIDGASEPAVIVQGCVPFNINTGTSTLQISSGVALIDGNFREVAAFAGSYPAYLRPDGTYTTVLPGSGSFIAFDPYTSQNYADVQRRAMSYLGEIRMTAAAADLAKFDGTGLGKWDMKGWALCNGANGTFDLRDRFVVGYRAGAGEYGTLGNLGGSASVTLTVANLPAMPGNIDSYGLIRKSLPGENVTVGSVNSDRSGIEPDVYNSPLDYPYADAAGTGHENRPPYIVLAYMQRI